MKILKKILAVITALTLAATLATPGNATVVNAKEADLTTYIALGDSVTAPSDGYVSIVAKSLEVSYKNFGISGYTAEDVLKQVKNDTNVRNSIKNADILTLDIGSNDMMYALFEHTCNALGCENNYFAMMNEFKSLQRKYQQATGFNKIRVGMEIGYKAMKINKAIHSQTNMNKSTSEYSDKLNNIIKEIRNLNPNIKIYLGNIYNPSFNAPSIKIGPYTLVDFYKTTDLWDNAYNKTISNVAGKYGYKVADVHGAINNSSLIIATWDTGNFDPHPSTAGHQAIANVFLNIMK